MKTDFPLIIITCIIDFAVLVISAFKIHYKNQNVLLPACILLFALSASVVTLTSYFVTGAPSMGLAMAYLSTSAMLLTEYSRHINVRTAIALLLGAAVSTLSYFEVCIQAALWILFAFTFSFCFAVQLRKIVSPSLVAARVNPDVVTGDVLRFLEWLPLCVAQALLIACESLFAQCILCLLVFIPLAVLNLNLSEPGKVTRRERILLVMTKRRLNSSDGDGEIRKSSEESHKVLFQAIDNWIRNEKAFLYYNNLSQDAVAEHFCTNRTYVAYAVSRYSGMSYSDYINKVRLEYAMQLAEKDPHITVSRLASEAGYPVVTTFAMAFKRMTGITPGEWLNDLRNRKKKDVSLPANE